MPAQESLREAIKAVFAYHPPKKEISTEKVRTFLAEYLNIAESEISLEELKMALRESPFAVAKPLLRGSCRLGWFFLPSNMGSTATKSKSVKKTIQYKEKPLFQSQRLKR